MASNRNVSLEYQFQQLAVTKNPPAGLVIGIDFGTTFSGVAFALPETLKAKDVTTMVNNIGMIRSWGVSSSFAEKTPTIISYTKSPPVWGASAANLDPEDPKVTYFKLGLQPGSYKSDLPDSKSLPFLKPNYRHPTWPNKNAQQFAEDYLKCLVTYIRERFFPSEYGPAFLGGQTISWVITVPAIWKDGAKDLTRKAAEKAGIPGRNLELITEPEAAALYSASLCPQVDLKSGDRFLICDAGGGTVVSRPSFSHLTAGSDCLQNRIPGTFRRKGMQYRFRCDVRGCFSSRVVPKAVVLQAWKLCGHNSYIAMY
jgi:molecular chaperone DnaK (HSP70)